MENQENKVELDDLRRGLGVIANGVGKVPKETVEEIVGMKLEIESVVDIA